MADGRSKPPVPDQRRLPGRRPPRHAGRRFRDFQEAIDNRLLSSPPILAPIQDQSARYSDTVTYTISATDADSDCADLSFSATGLPSGLSLTDNGDCTATVSGIISAEFGSYPVTYTVTDASGPSDSATGTFTVRPLYTFDGFFSPVDNLPTVNVVKAGSVVPVRFSLGGDFGLDVFAADSPWSVNIPTNPGAPLDSIEETVTAGSSGLSYAEGTGRYTYVWKTSKNWTGTSRQLVVKFKDGNEGRSQLHVQVGTYTRAGATKDPGPLCYLTRKQSRCESVFAGPLLARPAFFGNLGQPSEIAHPLRRNLGCPESITCW